MFRWYKNYRETQALSRELGGHNEAGFDIEDDRSLWQKLTKPYEPEVDIMDELRALRAERPELFR